MVKQLEFKGIVRATSAMNNADGNCEEVVNLRKESGVLRVVGKKKPIVRDVDYEQVYVHKYSSFENYVGIKEGKVVWFAAREGEEIVPRDRVICSVGGKVSFNHLNNILLIADGEYIFKTIFKDGAYGLVSGKLPAYPLVDIKYSGREEGLGPHTISFTIGNALQQEEARSSIYGILNELKSLWKPYTEGRFMLIVVYELFDGSLTKPTPPLLMHLGGWSDILHWSNGENFPGNTGDVFKADFRVEKVGLQKVSLQLKAQNFSEFKDVVKGVQVYASPVVSFYDPENVAFRGVVNDTDQSHHVRIMEKRFTEKDVEKALFYKVAEFDVSEADSGTFKDLDLSDGVLTASRTLSVDSSGLINTTGSMHMYNSRLHLFDLKRSFVHDDNMSQLSDQRGLGGRYIGVFYIKTESDTIVVKYELRATVTGGNFIELPKLISFPDSRAYRCDIFDTKNHFITSVILKPSATYNFAFYKFNEICRIGIADKPGGGDILDNNIVEGKDEYKITYRADRVVVPDEKLTFDSSNQLIVSESSNPYYFPAEHSYLMPGEIVNLAVNTEQISSSQVGMYPLYVFTTEGVYALQVGDGKVLYSNVIPISSEVATKGSRVLQTKYGIVFVTESGLRLIAGTEVVDLSEAVGGNADMNVRRSPIFGKFEKLPRVFDPAYLLSQINFDEYIKGAVMGYDISKDELIVSHPGYSYSYVYNLKVKEWHKITEVFTDFNRHLGVTRKVYHGPTRACAVISFHGACRDKDWFAITIDSQRIEYTLKSNGEMRGAIIAKIIDRIEGFRAERQGDRLLVYAPEVGTGGNEVPLFLEYSGDTAIKSDGFAGGRDEWYEGSIDVCDIREEIAGAMPVYVQTRPISLDSFGFKKMARMLFRGEFKPTGLTSVFSVLGSDDLVQWDYVGSVNVAQARNFAEVQRSPCSRRHFVVLMNGIVEPGHAISVAEIEGEGKWDNRPR